MEQPSKVYLITDRTQTRGRPLSDVVKAALEAGVRFVQLREKDLSSRELLSIARELRQLTSQYNAKLLINDRIDIALDVGADGIHLGHQSVSVKDARRAFEISSLPGTVPILRRDKAPPSGARTSSRPSVNRDSPLFLIGVSTHSLEEALQAESDGADFITFGPVYHTPSKAVYGEPVGIDKLKEAAEAVNIPVFALGGVKMKNIREVMSAGAHGVAVISAIMAADDVKKAAENIQKTIPSPP